ncbi:MAG: hypothetical protein NTU91_00930 [Chloroflexi bacterium]|nr:hypothetical protein [Chloroflexota bacterium]
MGYAITTDPVRARLVVACDPPGSREEWLRTIHELSGHQPLRSAWSVVIDARGLTWTVGLEDVQAIRGRVRAELRPGGPVAILSGPGAHFGAARQLATWLQIDGLTVEVFRQESEAEAWLSVMGGPSPSEDDSREPFPPKG